jgi:hypothetical protein
MSKLTAELLRADIEELEAELASDPRHRRLRKLRDLLEDYEHLGAPTIPIQVVGSVGATATAAEAAGKAYALTKAGKVRREIASLMRAKGSSVTRSEMLTHLQNKKLMGGEAKPMKRLSIYLNYARKDGLFETDGVGNWYFK